MKASDVAKRVLDKKTPSYVQDAEILAREYLDLLQTTQSLLDERAELLEQIERRDARKEPSSGN